MLTVSWYVHGIVDTLIRGRAEKGTIAVVRVRKEPLVLTSRVLVGGAILGPLLGLGGCAYELSDWPVPSADVTVTVPDTSDDETTSTSEPNPTDTSETPTQQSSDTDATTSTTSSDVSSSGTVDPCDNDKLDEGETAIDCGGDDCQPCGVNLPCLENSDCQSEVCNVTCLPAGCGNGEIDGKETDRDCGGDCPACEDGADCSIAADCVSGVCDGTCQAPACDDEVKNGDESGVDCGTQACGLCPNGATCTDNDQCEKGACTENNVCADPECTDLRKNGDETDTDCGGSCPPCKDDAVCVDADDCENHVCTATSATVKRCRAAECDDTVQNGDESAVDCGGSDPDCPRCPDGSGCNMASDCESSVCSSDGAPICSEPSCTDEVRNGTEVGIDCGGDGNTCDRCEDGGPCAAHSDCASNSCDGTTCLEASCTDGRQNPGESDTDCGGSSSCDRCGYGLDCGSDGDCMSNDCSTTCQKGVVGAACAGDGDCLSNACTNDVCLAGFRGAACMTGAECQSGYCKTTDNTCGSGGLGAACEQASDCASALCSTTCQASRFSVKSDGGNDTAVVNSRFQIQANAADPARAWQDLAVLYYFAVVSPETHVNFQSRYYAGPNQTTRDSRFLAINQSSDWVMIWRAAAGNIVTVPTASATTIELQTRDNPWSTFNFGNDYSYRTGGYAENTKMVVCQRVDGRWAHTQGTPPSSFTNPCSFVVDTCADTAATCDVLERAD